MKPEPDFASSGTVKLRKIDGLPCSKLETPFFQRPHQVIPKHGRFDVGGGVSFPMAVFPVFPRNGLFQGRRQIPPHIRIRPLLDRHRRRSVRDENVEQPVAPTPPGGRLLQ